MKSNEWERVTWEVLSSVQTGRMSLADAQEKLDKLRVGWKGYVVVDPKSDNYKYSPIYMDRREATFWLAENGDNDLEVVEVDILLASQSELDQPK